MADRKLRVLLKKIYSNGDKDTIFFKSRAKDVFIDEDGSTTLQDTVDKVNAIQSGATKVEDSNTNGNIKINGAETNVYTHPNSGVTAGTYNKVTVNAQGHVTSASNVTDWTGTVSGDISNATATFTTASSRANITSGANIKTTLGKIAKYFADLKSLAFVDKVGTANLDTTLTTAYNNRVTTDKVTTSTSITASGWVADARAIATLQNQINTINSNLSIINGKISTDKNYVNSLHQRTNIVSGRSSTIAQDIVYIIKNKGIVTGEVPVSNTAYSDAPENWNNYGLICFRQHGDNYVTVLVYGEGNSAPISYRKLNYSTGAWVQSEWCTIHMEGLNTLYARKYVASESSTANGGGFMFDEDATDTGMGSDGNGKIYFATNGVKYRFEDIPKTYVYDTSKTIDLSLVTEVGIHTFKGSVPIKNGPSGITTMPDASMFVTGDTHGFKLLVHPTSGVYYQTMSYKGTLSSWKHLS